MQKQNGGKTFTKDQSQTSAYNYSGARLLKYIDSRSHGNRKVNTCMVLSQARIHETYLSLTFFCGPLRLPPRLLSINFVPPFLSIYTNKPKSTRTYH